jgi:hypothetical protein
VEVVASAEVGYTVAWQELARSEMPRKTELVGRSHFVVAVIEMMKMCSPDSGVFPVVVNRWQCPFLYSDSHLPCLSKH